MIKSLGRLLHRRDDLGAGQLVHDEVCVDHRVEFHDLSEALADQLAIVDVLLRVVIDQVVVETDFVLLEVRDCRVVYLAHQRSDVSVVALNLSFDGLDLSAEVSDGINFPILRLEHGLEGVFATTQLLQVLLFAGFSLHYREPLALEVRLGLDGLKHGCDIKHFPTKPELHNLEGIRHTFRLECYYVEWLPSLRCRFWPRICAGA